MPLYSYRCDTCREKIEEFRAVDDRDGGVHLCRKTSDQVERRSGRLVRRFVAPHMAAIPGIYNRLNKDWNEDGLPVDVRYSDVLPNQE